MLKILLVSFPFTRHNSCSRSWLRQYIYSLPACTCTLPVTLHWKQSSFISLTLRRCSVWQAYICAALCSLRCILGTQRKSLAANYSLWTTTHTTEVWTKSVFIRCTDCVEQSDTLQQGYRTLRTKPENITVLSSVLSLIYMHIQQQTQEQTKKATNTRSKTREKTGAVTIFLHCVRCVWRKWCLGLTRLFSNCIAKLMLFVSDFCKNRALDVAIRDHVHVHRCQVTQHSAESVQLQRCFALSALTVWMSCRSKS